MEATREAPIPSAGPHRWSFRSYAVQERTTPGLRRFEIRSPRDELVATCRVRRSDSRLVLYGQTDEKEELFRMEPATVRQFDKAFDLVDALNGRAFAQVRKRLYKPLDKAEWFVHNPDGDLIGMVNETAPRPGLLQRVLPVGRLGAKAWAIHWGQSIGGVIHPRRTLLGERLEVNLSLDKKQEVDRRVALALALLLRVDGIIGKNGN